MTFPVNCLILGDKLFQTFTVDISDDNQNIAILKKLIKEEKSTRLKDVDASDLNLWQVDFSIEDHELEQCVLSHGPPLHPLRKLQIFKNEPDNQVHVIVEVPGKSQ